MPVVDPQTIKHRNESLYTWISTARPVVLALAGPSQIAAQKYGGGQGSGGLAHHSLSISHVAKDLIITQIAT